MSGKIAAQGKMTNQNISGLRKRKVGSSHTYTHSPPPPNLKGEDKNKYFLFYASLLWLVPPGQWCPPSLLYLWVSTYTQESCSQRISNSNLSFNLFTSAVISGFFGVLPGMSESSLIDSVGAACLKFPGTLLTTCQDSELFKLRIKQKTKKKTGRRGQNQTTKPLCALHIYMS